MTTIKMIAANDFIKPSKPEKGDAGIDLKLANDVHIPPGSSVFVGTGVKVEVPEGHFGLVVPRSSTGKKKLSLNNTVGIIDSTYQGEVYLDIKNNSREGFLGYKGDRLFQLIILPYIQVTPVFVKTFEKETKRGERGFGSTGT